MLRSRSARTARSRSLGANALARPISSSALGIFADLVCDLAGIVSATLMASSLLRKLAPGGFVESSERRRRSDPSPTKGRLRPSSTGYGDGGREHERAAGW